MRFVNFGILRKPFDSYVVFDFRLYRGGWFYFQVWRVFVKRVYS